MSESEREFKIVFLGEAAVGKTSIVQRFQTDSFDEDNASTIGACYSVKEITVDGQTIKLNIWDTAGQEKFKSLAPMYYRYAAACLIVYDVTNADSFEKAKSWLDELEQKNPECSIRYLVGNKIDLDSSKVQENELEEVCTDKKCKRYEVSAKAATGIDLLFDSLASDLIKVEAKSADNKKVHLPMDSDEESKCC